MALYVKICGVTRVADALSAVEAGADAVGVNFVATSKRCVSEDAAGRIVEAVGDRAEVIAVVADWDPARLRRLRSATGIEWLQLHGTESPEWLEAVLPKAYKALRVGGPEDVAAAAAFGGERLLVDAKVPGHLGGTGARFDWSLVTELVRARRVLLAGGLTPENVAEAVSRVRPWGIDVASGVERKDDPREKDPERVRAFIARARSAASCAAG